MLHIHTVINLLKAHASNKQLNEILLPCFILVIINHFPSAIHELSHCYTAVWTPCSLNSLTHSLSLFFSLSLPLSLSRHSYSFDCCGISWCWLLSNTETHLAAMTATRWRPNDARDTTPDRSHAQACMHGQSSKSSISSAIFTHTL